MPSTVTDPITRLFRACEPEELQPEDSRYVNLDEVRGENLPLLYERAIRRADPLRPEVKIFAGHLGVGKTSELLRLKAMLEKPAAGKKPFLVIFSNVSNVLDLNDLDFPDLLVFLASQVQEQLREAKIPGFSSTSTLLNTVWDELKSRLFPEVSLTEVNVEVPFGSLAIELKNRPNSRDLLRAEIEKQSTSLLDAVNDRLREATAQLRRNGWEGLVLIVDGLDKLVRRDLDDGKSNTHERLFVHRSQQLASLQAHVIYTVPISLIYSPLFTQLEQIFGEHPTPVPMIRLRDGKKADLNPDTPGLRKMKEILEARCRYAQVDLREVFDSTETCIHLCRMTGGHPRHLMIFLQPRSAG